MATKKSNSVSKAFSRGTKKKVSSILSSAPKGQQSNLPGSSAPQMSTKPSTGLVNSKGQSIASPTFGIQGVNIGQSVASGGLRVVSGGGKRSSPSSVNIKDSLSSGGLVLGSSTSVAPRTSLSSNASFGGSSGGSSLASNTPNIPSSNVINTPTLGASSTQLTFPEQPIADYSQFIPTPQEQVVQEATEEKDSALKDLLKSMAEPPSSADAYKKAQKETDILRKQQEVNDLTGTLNGIVAKGEAQQLQLIGQGRGIPEAIIGGQQAQIARETAIAALPVQAQLSAAQGNLEMANDNLETLFKIYSDDAKNEYEYKKEVKKMVYEYASEKEKRALDKLDKLEDRAYQEKQDVLATNKTIAIEAAKNGATAGVLTKIANATNLAEAISVAGQYMIDTQIIKLDNGETVVVDSTGKIIKSLGGAKAEGGNNFVVTNDILKSTYGNDVVSLIAGVIKGSGAKQSQSTNDAINVIAGLQSFVRNNPEGVFEGLGAGQIVPGRFASEETRTNRSDIEAINLKVQQWASGASLTEAQTKSVDKITPRAGDTDAQIASKVNALANYMVSQVSGQLAGQGVGFAIDRVDLFTKTPEQELQELYQDPVMQQKIIEAAQLFPSYTDAEILQIVQP